MDFLQVLPGYFEALWSFWFLGGLFVCLFLNELLRSWHIELRKDCLRVAKIPKCLSYVPSFELLYLNPPLVTVFVFFFSKQKLFPWFIWFFDQNLYDFVWFTQKSAVWYLIWMFNRHTRLSSSWGLWKFFARLWYKLRHKVRF